MTVHTECVSSTREGEVGVIVIDNPPVNAINDAVREGIHAGVLELAGDPSVRAILLSCAHGTFMAGADIRRLSASGPPRLPTTQIITSLEDCPKPVIALLEGHALGGGLEFALGCHYRCATPATKLGLPEVNLGLIPGAGGTQRLPRLVGLEAALGMIVDGKPLTASRALELGLIDRLVDESRPLDAALRYARELIEARAVVRPTRALRARAPDPAKALEDAHTLARRVRRGGEAPPRAIDAVAASVVLPFEEGLALEATLFAQCRSSPQSRALRHLFMAERQAAKLEGEAGRAPARDLKRVAIIGGGTMGRGIAMACAASQFDVTLIEVDEQALARARGVIEDTWSASVAKGRMTAPARTAALALIRGSSSLADAADADLVIEAIHEDLDAKRALFGKLDALCPPGTVLATNTSALDIDRIAGATSRAGDVVGLHFFSPAHVMRLLEIVRGASSSPGVLATSMRFAKRLRKLGVIAGNCDGFIGNRMLAGYRREAEFLLLEGASPRQVDEALVGFGMSMGPFVMGDMAGLDVSAAGRRRRRAEGRLPEDPRFGAVPDRLVEAGWYGQKSGRGYYRYEAGSHKAIEDDAVLELIERESARLGVGRRSISPDEIVTRCILPLVNEGARILEEGVAQRPGDIDVVWTHGYGFPRLRGGPLCHADELGVREVLGTLQALERERGSMYWTPAPLIAKLAAEDSTFSSLNVS